MNMRARNEHKLNKTKQNKEAILTRHKCVIKCRNKYAISDLSRSSIQWPYCALLFCFFLLLHRCASRQNNWVKRRKLTQREGEREKEHEWAGLRQNARISSISSDAVVQISWYFFLVAALHIFLPLKLSLSLFLSIILFWFSHNALCPGRHWFCEGCP